MDTTSSILINNIGVEIEPQTPVNIVKIGTSYFATIELIEEIVGDLTKGKVSIKVNIETSEFQQKEDLRNLVLGSTLFTEKKIDTIILNRNIVFCDHWEGYTVIHRFNEELFVCSKTMKEMRQLLPPEHFMEITKGFFVNKNYIESFKIIGRGGEVCLPGNILIKISRSNMKDYMLWH